MSALERGTHPEKRKGRATLSVRDPLIESLVAGLDFDGTDIDDLRRIGKGLVRHRNKWDIERRANGLHHPGRLHRRDADKVLRNALSRYREGGGE